MEGSLDQANIPTLQGFEDGLCQVTACSIFKVHHPMSFVSDCGVYKITRPVHMGDLSSFLSTLVSSAAIKHPPSRDGFMKSTLL